MEITYQVQLDCQEFWANAFDPLNELSAAQAQIQDLIRRFPGINFRIIKITYTEEVLSGVR